MRKSRRGTQFFAHKAVGGCVTAPETEHHLRLKRMAVEMARAHGWDAESEVAGMSPSGEAWTADVLAQKGQRKIAIEIQWSGQTNEETLRRQARYAQSGVRCLWLLRRSGFPVDRALPAARVGGTAEEGFVAFVPTGSAEQSVSMREFLNAAFGGRFRFGLPCGLAATASIRVGPMTCWCCGAETRIITGVDLAVGPHDWQLSIAEFTDYPDLFGHVRGHLPRDPWMGAIKHRFSRTQERSYLSNGCAHCDALIGEFFEHDAWEQQETVCRFHIRVTERWGQAIRDRQGWEDGWGVYPLECVS